MALSITNRGTGTHNTAATSFTLSPGSNCTAGATVALCISADNNSAGGSTNNIDTVTDSLGNTWSKVQGPVFDNGAAAAGVQGAIFTTRQNVGTLTTGTVITVNFGTSTTAKTWTMTEVNVGASKIAIVRTSGTKAAGATGTAATSGATSTVNIGEVTLCAFFIEAGTTQTCTGDSDTTNGSWSTLQYTEIGSTTSGNCIASQAKLQTTANSTQTYDVTLGISSDYHAAWAIFQEVDASVNVTPTAAVLTLSAATPTIELGAIDVTPTPALLTLSAAAPTVTLGALDVTPTAALLTLLAAAPTVDNTGGGVDVTPTAASLQLLAASPTVTLGAVDVTPTPAVLTLAAAAPTVQLGGLSVTPVAAALTLGAATPTVTLGVRDVTPTPAVLQLLAANPQTANGINVTPIAAVLVLGAAAPTVTLGPLDVVPTPAVLELAAATPGVELGPVTVTPSPAALTLAAASPVVASFNPDEIIVVAAVGASVSSATVDVTSGATVHTAGASAVTVITSGSSVET